MSETYGGITYDAIYAANSKLQKYSEEKGADCPKNLTEYVSVSQRIKAFRMVCPGGGIRTEEMPAAEGYVKYYSTLTDENGSVLATGTAIKSLQRYNKYEKKWEYDPDALTKCETKAVGRALAFMGLGIDCGIASAEDMDEFQNMQLQQMAAQIQAQPQGQVVNSIPVGAQQMPVNSYAAPVGYGNPVYQQPSPSGSAYYGG